MQHVSESIPSGCSIFHQLSTGTSVIYAGNSLSNPLSNRRFGRPSLIITVSVNYSMIYRHGGEDERRRASDFCWGKSPCVFIIPSGRVIDILEGTEPKQRLSEACRRKNIRHRTFPSCVLNPFLHYPIHFRRQSLLPGGCPLEATSSSVTLQPDPRARLFHRSINWYCRTAGRTGGGDPHLHGVVNTISMASKKPLNPDEGFLTPSNKWVKIPGTSRLANPKLNAAAMMNRSRRVNLTYANTLSPDVATLAKRNVVTPPRTGLGTLWPQSALERRRETNQTYLRGRRPRAFLGLRTV